MEEQDPKFYTIVYNNKGEEIDRREGKVHIQGSEFDESQLPIRYTMIKVEEVAEYRIEKK